MEAKVMKLNVKIKDIKDKAVLRAKIIKARLEVSKAAASQKRCCKNIRRVHSWQPTNQVEDMVRFEYAMWNRIILERNNELRELEKAYERRFNEEV